MCRDLRALVNSPLKEVWRMITYKEQVVADGAKRHFKGLFTVCLLNFMKGSRHFWTK